MIDLQTLHRRAARVLPEVLQTSGVLVETRSHAELVALLLPLRRKRSGVVGFRLRAGTAEAMARTPLKCLQQATQGRGAPGHIGCGYHPWRLAMVPRQWLHVLGAACDVGDPLPHPDNDATPQAVEVCFTTRTDQRALLVVIASARLALYAWRD